MDEPIVEADLADTEPERRPGPWKLILLVAIVTLIGVWLVPGESPRQGDDTSQPQSVSIPAAQEPQDTADQAPSLLGEPLPLDAGGDLTTMLPAPAAGLRNVRPGSRARSLIADIRAKGGEPDLDALYAAAVKAQDDGEMADAYLLYFFAAREGHANAALTLGNQADPATHNPGDSVFEAPDMNQAHKWYQMAAQHGNLDAKGLLQDLRGRVEQLAAQGNSQAQRLSLLWQ